jgi:DNA repair exonuclease SbcCD ATPase subunit
MKLLSLTLKNVRKFRGRHKIRLSMGEPGLYFIDGENRDAPRLGSNGAGKTSLLDALSWCLYGKGLRGTRGADLRTWRTSRQMAARTGLLTRGHPLVVERRQSPNRLTVKEKGKKPKIVSQEEINAIIGLTYEEFKNSLVIGHTANLFFDMSPSQKLTMLSEVLDLDGWLGRSLVAETQLHEVQSEITSKETKCAALIARRLELKNSIKSYKKKDALYEGERARQIKRARSANATNKQELAKQRTALKIAKTKLREARESAVSARQDSHRVTPIRNDLVQRGNKFHTKMLIKDKDLSALREELKKFKLAGGDCPYCYQPVTEHHLKKERKRIRREIRESKADIAGVNKKMARVRTKIAELDKTESTNIAASTKADFEVETLDVEAMSLVNEVVRLKALIKDGKAHIGGLKKEQNPFSDLVTEAQSKRQSLLKRIKKLDNRLRKHGRKEMALKYWVRGFKQIRLFVIDRALTMLEVEINNALSQLGLVDWSIHLDVEREKKTGGIAKGFHVGIKAPDSPKMVPWESWSGGENQRLRIAGALGLANLILIRKGVNAGFEFWDERTSFLSGEGITDFMHLLHERATKMGKQIFVIDHRTLDYPFKSTIKVIRKDGCSSATVGRG